MNKTILKIAVAAVIYGLFAVYLFYPHLDDVGLIFFILPVNLFLGAIGCFVLSCRWVGNFWAQLLAGAIYGFGPYFLGISIYHPLAATFTAAIPWLFWPAALGAKNKSLVIKALLTLLPFAAIVTFFQVTRQFGFFPVHLHTKLSPTDLLGLVSPTVAAKRNLILIGFYHVPLAALLMGFYILVLNRRYIIITIVIAATAVGFCNSFLGVSPVIWVSISAVCFAIVTGLGVQALAISGSADGKLLATITAAMLLLAGICGLFAVKCNGYFANLGVGYGYLFSQSAKMYLLAAAAMGMIYFFAKTAILGHWIRWCILIFAMAVDIFFSARFIVDNLF